jgi:L-iditol 2-dehydrogenase
MAPSVSLHVLSHNVIPTHFTLQVTNGIPERKVLSAPLPNPSLQVTADHNLKQQDAPVYAPGHGEVLLHIKATGVCGYDSQRGYHLTYPLMLAGPTFTFGEQGG